MPTINNQKKYAVVGVSKNPQKFGFKIYQKLVANGFAVFPINPKYEEFEGQACFPDLVSTPESINIAITVVPPQVTNRVVEDAKAAKIPTVWMQPGSESDEAIAFCQKNNIEVIYNACIVTDGLKQSF